jgi:hypothetical protein
MRIPILAFTSLILATPATALDENDRFIMTIDAGRLGVMVDQSARILGLEGDPAGASTDTFATLKAAVREYRRVLSVACARHTVKAPCEAAYYNPLWLSEPDAPGPGLEALRSRIDEAQDRIAPLWGDLCATLPKEHDPSLCQIE